MVKGIILNTRDFGLLKDCYDNVQLRFAQVHKRHFANRSRTTTTNRLRKLRKAGYLVGRRVGIIIYQSEPEEVGVVYQVTKSAIKILQRKYAQESFRAEPARLSTLSLSHDLLLTDVLTKLSQIVRRERVINGKVFFNKAAPGKRLPDAVIVNSSGKTMVAIELELTTKSSDRYRKLILNYKLQQDFPFHLSDSYSAIPTYGRSKFMQSEAIGP